MGFDGSISTIGYCENGQVPEFKVFKDGIGEGVSISGLIPEWSSNEIYTLGSLQANEIPSSVMLNPAFPNPFNPQTTISFSIPSDNSIKLGVYDSMGRIVADIASGLYQAGYYEFEWDAAEFSSGIYFVKMEIDGSIHMQKIMLLK